MTAHHTDIANNHSPIITERTKLISNPSSASYLTYFPTSHPSPPSPSRRLLRKISKQRPRLHSWIGDAGFDIHFERKRKDVTWRQWGKEEISGDALVLPLLIVTFSCALADSITLQRYSTFATSMTGNTVLLAIRVMGHTEKPPLLAGVSLLGFVISGLIFGQLGAVIGHRRRDWLLFNFAAQIGILFTNVLLVSPFASRIFRPEGRYGWVYLLLLAIQGGIQVTQAANSGARELPTAMMTTPYAALISDPSLFSSGRTTDVRSRNRRVIYIVIFWLGAFFGAALSSWTNMFWPTSAVLGCKVVVIAYLGLTRGKRAEETEDSEESEQEEEDEDDQEEQREIEAQDGGTRGEAGYGTVEDEVENGIDGDGLWSGISQRRSLGIDVQDALREISPRGGRGSAKDRQEILRRDRSRRGSEMAPPTLDRRPETGRRESRDEWNVAM